MYSHDEHQRFLRAVLAVSNLTAKSCIVSNVSIRFSVRYSRYRSLTRIVAFLVMLVLLRLPITSSTVVSALPIRRMMTLSVIAWLVMTVKFPYPLPRRRWKQRLCRVLTCTPSSEPALSRISMAAFLLNARQSVLASGFTFWISTSFATRQSVLPTPAPLFTTVRPSIWEIAKSCSFVNRTPLAGV